MRTIRLLVGITLLACAALSHAENAYYPAAFEQNPAVVLDMPVGTATLTLPDAVGAAYLRDAATTWSTQYRTSNRFFIELDATPGNAYDNVGAPATMASYAPAGGAQSWFAVVEARHQGRAAVELRVGTDLNGDGLPQANEELCRIRADLYDNPRCLLDLRSQTAHPLWAFAHIVGPFDSGFAIGDFVTVSIATADFQVNGGQVSVTPSTDITTTRSAGSNGAPVHLDVSYRPSPAHATSDAFEAIGGLLIAGRDQGDATVFPLRLNITPTVQHGQGHALAARYDAFDEVLVELQPGETYYGLYADNPGQDLLELVLLNPAAQVLVWQEDFPAASLDSRAIPTPPPPHPTQFLVGAGSLPGAPNYLQICEGCPANQRIVAGRIRMVVSNMNPVAPISARIRLLLSRTADFATRQGPGLLAPSGNYYNPLRSGDGIFLDLVNQLQVFYWYTFDTNGQPVWYTAGAEPSYDNGAVGTFNTTLYRIRQPAAGAREVVPVGRIVLTAASNDHRELMFSWSIDGEHGRNRIQLAAAPGCTQQAAGLQLNLTGHWFNPDAPGWGTNLLGLRNDIAEGLYLFDAMGDPRWVFGGLALNNGAWSGDLYQFKGVCPTCTYVAPTHTPVGSANLIFSGSSDARASYVVNFAAPLFGAFTQISAPIHRATSAVECSP